MMEEPTRRTRTRTGTRRTANEGIIPFLTVAANDKDEENENLIVAEEGGLSTDPQKRGARPSDGLPAGTLDDPIILGADSPAIPPPIKKRKPRMRSQSVQTSPPSNLSEPPAQIQQSESFSKSIADGLTCTICMEIFHNCVSVLPCVHKFCAGCICRWLKKSKTCPCCRVRMNGWVRDRSINSMVDAFLASYPERRRNENDLAVLDRDDTITKRTK